MSWSLSMGTLLGLAAAAISGLLAVYSWGHREKRMTLQFLILEISLLAWSLSYGLQMGYGNLATQLVWQRITLGIAGFIPTVFLLFVFAYTSRDTWLERPRLGILLTEPIVWSVLCLTNPLHGLIWTDAALVATALGPVTALDFGVGYAIHIVYAYSIVLVGIGLLVTHTTKIAPAYRTQVGLLVAGVVPPFLTHILFTLGQSPFPALDLTPFVFAFTGVVFGLALFEFDLLELPPIAREQAFYTVNDGLLIVNQEGEIIDVIGVATDILSPTPSIGSRYSDFFPETSLDALDNTEMAVSLDGDRRVYQFQVTSLSAHHDQDVGSLIIMRDITGLHESRQRLSVSNRVLRHNLRNDMNIVLGYAQDLESQLDGDRAADARLIREKAEHILGLTQKAQQIATVHNTTESTGESIDLTRILRELISDVRATHPDVQFSFEQCEEMMVGGVDPMKLRLAVQNLIDNAIHHNDATSPQVHIDVTDSDGEIRINISDNGPGIPEIEQEAIGASTETPLGHSQGLGLWLTYWCATSWGGDLTFDTDETGSTVTLTLPTTDSRPRRLPNDDVSNG